MADGLQIGVRILSSHLVNGKLRAKFEIKK
jgi:hypothetical protein